MERLSKPRLSTRLAAHTIAGLIRAVKGTSTKIYEPPDLIAKLSAEVPFIMAMWHGQFMMLPELNNREFNVSAIVARHGDADVMAIVLEKFGIEAIRGAGAGDRKKDRGGAHALRAAIGALEAGTIVAMTADVPPRNPRKAGLGIVTLARHAGRPIIPVAAATSRYHAMNTWSRMTINLPFSRFVIVAGDPIFVPADADDDAMEKARLAVEHSLEAATERAYELARAGAKPPYPATRSRKRTRDCNNSPSGVES